MPGPPSKFNKRIKKPTREISERKKNKKMALGRYAVNNNNKDIAKAEIQAKKMEKNKTKKADRKQMIKEGMKEYYDKKHNFQTSDMQEE